MKTLLLFILLCFSNLVVQAQITTPVIRANFGVDADLRANFFDGFLQNGNDDWFNNGTNGTGQFIIDTTGAAAMVSRYATDAAFRRQPFFRTMRVPQYSVVNNRLLIDAVYIRDYNGQSGGDETAFVSSNKNGASPQVWTGGITSVLDKNDIAEMMVHVRRDGPNRTNALWFFGGLSLQGTTGNRYFDFELYQTDIFYTRSTGQFTNYGPDEGHTSWEFDASGNITKPGDVIFSAEYSSSSLTFIEARIWVNRNALSITPASFDWSGSFDGASNSSQFGYASIRPKVSGTYYTGLQSGNGTWAGPFGFINGGNTYQTTYAARQFMEFSVNLTFLGLDPLTLLSGGACGLPFRRILVKTRTSTSFSSELKDFIGPFDFFKAPPVKAVAEVPLFCGVMSTSDIKVLQPLDASVYTWHTPDGMIEGSNTGPQITANAPGTYIVTQQLLDGCGAFATDTVRIVFDANCTTLANNVLDLRGVLSNQEVKLEWIIGKMNASDRFDIQRSTDGKSFQTVAQYAYMEPSETGKWLKVADPIANIASPYLYYRVRQTTISGVVVNSRIIRLANTMTTSEIQIFPNPVVERFQITIPIESKTELSIRIHDLTGNLLYSDKMEVEKGNTVYASKKLINWKSGMYMVQLEYDGKTYWRKMLVAGYYTAVK
jgi:hypothetical protein